MDFLYGHDRKLGYLEEESDMVDFLNDSKDMFESPISFPNAMENYENDWFNNIPLLDDPVLHDKMMTDAMQPCIKSEHSYSINNGLEDSSLALVAPEDMDPDIFLNTSALDLTIKPSISTSGTDCSPTSLDNFFSSSSSTNNSSAALPTAVAARQQPTIIFTTSSQTASSPFFAANGDVAFSTIQIKQEPMDGQDQAAEQTALVDSIVMPLTPPGSSGSDSEGNQSPQHSAPSSPSRRSSIAIHTTCSPSSPLSPGKSFSQPLFVNPISQSGVLILSEEEKRTLIAEGYPIPSKLPLTKQEEKNLKKIRRKIKNKISAQESRRKKKEYLEALEKRVEAYNHENSDLKKKVESLENNNRSLLGQLQKLQSIVSKMPKMPKVAGASATQTGTALMVLVFCFALFLGTMSPSTMNIGYNTKPAVVSFGPQLKHYYTEPPRVPNFYEPINQMSVEEDDPDPYATPNLKSRMLMSVEQDNQCEDITMPWENALLCPKVEASGKDVDSRSMPSVELNGGATIEELSANDHQTTIVVVAALDNNNSNSKDVSPVMPKDSFSAPQDLLTADATQMET